MRRVAWFQVVIDTEDEQVAQIWLTTVNQGLDEFARRAAEELDHRITIVEPMKAGQSIPVVEGGVADRDDV